MIAIFYSWNSRLMLLFELVCSLILLMSEYLT